MSARPLPWYRDGLRFSCRGSGECCSGSPGVVWVNDDEMACLANHLGISVETFRSRHTRVVAGRRSLLETAAGDCAFLHPGQRRCQVYRARPVQCRSWPFWPQNVDTKQAWARTCHACAGAGSGALHPLADIDEQLLAVVRARRG